MKVDDPTQCGKRPLIDNQVYEVATNDYIAKGGSGFTILKSNNTQTDTGLPLRDAVLEVIVTSDKCLEYCKDRDGDVDLAGCSVYQGCLDGVNTFHSGFCAKVDKTGGTEFFAKAKGCAVDTAACYKDPDCYAPETYCAANECTACKSSASCMAADPDSFCVRGYCMKRNYVCMEGRCMRRCMQDSDCPYQTAGTEALCVGQVCQVPPSVSCMSDGECVLPYKTCFGSATPCQFDTDCGQGTYCRAGFCIPERPACANDQDCPQGTPCLFGLCGGTRLACTGNGACGDGGECRGGVCSVPCGNCTKDKDCPTGLACLKNLCVHTRAGCVDNRCRTLCAGDQDCMSGETCSAGRCMPTLCLVEVSGETRCLMNAGWKAQQTCLEAPCVDSRVDGRIGRILPENLGALEFGYIPNDPEDIDEY
jgi:hypothetical protein